MPENACVHLYECTHCHLLLRPRSGGCCIFCSYGSTPCPPRQPRAGRRPLDAETLSGRALDAAVTHHVFGRRVEERSNSRTNERDFVYRVSDHAWVRVPEYSPHDGLPRNRTQAAGTGLDSTCPPGRVASGDVGSHRCRPCAPRRPARRGDRAVRDCPLSRGRESHVTVNGLVCGARASLLKRKSVRRRHGGSHDGCGAIRGCALSGSSQGCGGVRRDLVRGLTQYKPNGNVTRPLSYSDAT